MGYITAKGRGGDYDYFYCLAQYRRHGECDLPHLPVSEVEDAVERQWLTVRFTDDQIADFSQRARDDLHRNAESGSRLIVDQRRRLAELERHKQKLVDAYMADALPIEELKPRQARVASEIADAKRLMQNAQTASDEVLARLEQVISLLTHAERLYAAVGNEARQLLNTAVFNKFTVDSQPDGPGKAAVITKAPLTPVIDAVLARRAAEDGNERTPGELSLTRGSILDQLAVAVVSSLRTSTRDVSRHRQHRVADECGCRKPAW